MFQIVERRDDVEPLWGDEFFEVYFTAGNETVIRSEILHLANLFSLVSVPLRHAYTPRRLGLFDHRIHTLTIRKSGTGKTQAKGLMYSIARYAGIPVRERKQATTAGAVGTVRNNGEIIYGDLFYVRNGIWCWNEAAPLLRAEKNEHTVDLVEVLNQVMDVKGHVSKRLAKGDVSYYTRVSLNCSTYPPEVNEAHYVESGFLPRFAFFFDQVDKKFYEDVIDFMLGNASIDTTLPDDAIPRLARTFQRLEEANIRSFDYSITNKNIIRDVIIRSVDFERYDTFVPRLVDLGLKFAAAHAVLYLPERKTATGLPKTLQMHGLKIEDEEITPGLIVEVKNEDIEWAANVLKLICESIDAFLTQYERNAKYSEVEKLWARLKRYAERHGTTRIRKRDIMRNFKYTRAELEPLLMTLAARGDIKVKYVDGTCWIELVGVQHEGDG